MLINLLNINSLKLILTLFILLILFPNKSRSQGLYWDPVDTVNSQYFIRECICIDKNTCIMRKDDFSGNRGAILQLTTDGGSTWDIIFADTSIIIKKPLKVIYYSHKYIALSFTPPANIILSGDSGTVWKSFDMGKNWSKENNDSSLIITYKMFDSIHGLKFTNIINTMLLKISVTYNGGNDWTELKVPDFMKWDLIFVNGITPEGNIYFYTLNEDDGYMLSWVLDSGKTWKHIIYGASEFKDIKFVNNNTGYAVRHDKADSNITKQVILKTVNGGESWYKVLDMNNKHGGLDKVTFYDENNLLVTGYRTSWIFRTNDGGSNWIEDRVTGIEDKTKSLLISSIVLCGPKCGFIATHYQLLKMSDKPVTSAHDDFVQNINLLHKHHSIIIDKNESVNLTLNNDFSKDISIRVFDFLGRLVFEINPEDVQADETILNFNSRGLSSGLYFINISNDSNNEYFKLLIK